MQKTIAVVGVGPGVGFAIARRFGRAGFRVAMVARNQSRLDSYSESLRGDGIEARGFAADASDPKGLLAALESAKQTFGPIDALYFGPKPEPEMLATPREINLANVRAMFDRLAVGAITAVTAVLPDMIARRDGSIIFSVPASAIAPVLYSANMAFVTSGLRNYALGLHIDLAKDNVFAGLIAVAGSIIEGGAGRERHLAAEARRPDDRGWEEYRKFEEELTTMIPADAVAALAFDMHTRRNRAEEVIGDPDICHRMREEILRAASAMTPYT